MAAAAFSAFSAARVKRRCRMNLFKKKVAANGFRLFFFGGSDAVIDDVACSKDANVDVDDDAAAAAAAAAATAVSTTWLQLSGLDARQSSDAAATAAELEKSRFRADPIFEKLILECFRFSAETSSTDFANFFDPICGKTLAFGLNEAFEDRGPSGCSKKKGRSATSRTLFRLTPDPP